jgi:hypothetical protein
MSQCEKCFAQELGRVMFLVSQHEMTIFDAIVAITEAYHWPPVPAMRAEDV